MIAELGIENFALFKQVRVFFEPGLNVLSGESGAGKSLALESLAALFGGRLSKERVGPWGESVTLEGVVYLEADDPRWEPLAVFGIEPDSSMIVQRQVMADGRSSYRIQGRPVPSQAVRDLQDTLIEYVGQNQLARAFVPDSLIEWLDGYAGLQKEREAVRQTFTVWQGHVRRVEELARRHSSATEVEAMRHEVQELEQLALQPQEDEVIAKELTRLRAGRSLIETGQSLYQLLDQDLLSKLDQAARLADQLSRLDQELANTAQTLHEALSVAEEARLDLGRWMDHLDLDPARLEILEARADLISRAKRRYGPELVDVLQHYRALRDRLEELDNLEWELASATRREAEAREAFDSAALALSTARRRAMLVAQESLTQTIREMEMPSARLVFAHHIISPSDSGIDAIELIFSASQGQEPKPLIKVASGGEAARVALALAVTGPHQKQVVFVFDEVDQGLGGQSAERVGQLLKSLGSRGQVLAVSHQAVVAAKAHHQLRVLKVTRTGQSLSELVPVTGEERVLEVARMLSGSQDRVALTHARRLLDEGAKPGA